MIDRLTVKYHEEVVGILSLTPDNKLCAFVYDKAWLVNGFSVSPLELPLKPGLFIALGTKTKISEKRCLEIYDEVYQNCGDILRYKITDK